MAKVKKEGKSKRGRTKPVITPYSLIIKLEEYPAYYKLVVKIKGSRK